VSMVPWRNAAGEIMGIVHSSLAVHELKASIEALRAANERLSNHMDNSPLAVLELDANLTVTRSSAQVTHVLGLDPKTLEGQPLLEAMYTGQMQPDLNVAVLQAAFARLQTGQETRNRVESVHTNGHGLTVHCEWFNSALTDSQGQVTSIMALVEDVTARVQAQEQLRVLALHDALTMLPNRNAMQQRLASSLARVSRSQATVVILFIDLDGFKQVNDQFGHDAGDEVLKEVGLRLVTAVREADMVARFGGDEFVVLLDSELQPQCPELICQRILDLLALPIAIRQGIAQIGASIGVASQTGPIPPLDVAHGSQDAITLMKRADAAMFEAKRAGKGCVRYAPNDGQKPVR
jgi:diguanylate cyclase (GGDEF)-like protein/PAS domain S-box-containing protein